MPDQFLELAWYTGGIIVLLFAVVLLGFFVQSLLAYRQRLQLTLAQLDASPAVLAFGESPTGRYINDVLNALLPKIDQVSDPAIRAIVATPLVTGLKELGILDDAKVVELATALVNNAIKLTNGVPDTQFSVTISEGTAPVSVSDVAGAKG